MSATKPLQHPDLSPRLDLGVQPLEHTIEPGFWDAVIGVGVGLAGGAAAYWVGTLIAT